MRKYVFTETWRQFKVCKKAGSPINFNDRLKNVWALAKLLKSNNVIFYTEN